MGKERNTFAIHPWWRWVYPMGYQIHQMARRGSPGMEMAGQPLGNLADWCFGILGADRFWTGIWR